MSVFKEEAETKRMIFNVRLDLARRLEKAKKDARGLGKKLDVDGAIDKAMEKFLKKAEKRISEVRKKRKGHSDEWSAEGMDAEAPEPGAEVSGGEVSETDGSDVPESERR